MNDSVKENDKSSVKDREFLIAQWNRFAANEENLINDTSKIFTIVVAIFGIASILGTESFYTISAIHLGIIMVMWYEAYKLRLLHLVKGYLAKIEDQLVDSNSETWYRNYEKKYVSHYSVANKYIWIPAFLVASIVLIYCIFREKSLFPYETNYITLFCVVNIVATILILLLPIASICMNEKFKNDIFEDPYKKEHIFSYFMKKNKDKKHKEEVEATMASVMAEIAEVHEDSDDVPQSRRENRKEKTTDRLKEKFRLDVNDELLIYRAMCVEKMKKREWDKIAEDKRFYTHKAWKEYIAKEYANHSKEDLEELAYELSHLIDVDKSYGESSNIIVSALAASVVTVCINGIFDLEKGDYSFISSWIGLSVLIILLLVLMGLIVYLLISFFKRILIDNKENRCRIKMLQEIMDIISNIAENIQDN